MAHNPHTVETVRQTLLQDYLKRRQPVVIDELANKSGFGQDTIRKMARSGAMDSFAESFTAPHIHGGKIRKRLHFVISKNGLADALQEACHA